MLKKRPRTLQIAILLIGLGTYARADIFDLNVLFQDGAQAVGTFTTDPTDTSILTWNFSITGSTLAPSNNFSTSNVTSGGANLYPSNIFAPPGTAVILAFYSAGFLSYADFYLGSDLSAGGSIPLTGALDCGDGTTCGVLATGSTITDESSAGTSSTPEPSAIILFGSVVGIFGATQFRRRKRMPAS
jgi:hypothetical protein